MEAKLVVIGDSLSQGFTSGAIYRPDLSYPALLARSMAAEFTFPTFTPAGGLPLNLEALVRELSQRFGARLRLVDLIALAFSVLDFLRRVEGYWDGPGRDEPLPGGKHYHNLASWGFQVGDADSINAALGQSYLAENPPSFLTFFTNSFLPFFITSNRVLNPTRQPEQNTATQLENAAAIAATQGIENLIFWLGANNALGTVTSLKVVPSTPEDLEKPPWEVHATLYRPEDFAVLYRRVTAKLARLKVRRLFLVTIPHVTIVPALRGISAPSPCQNGYFAYYTRPWQSPRTFNPERDPHLTGDQVREIDQTIDQYNEIIRATANRYGWVVIEAGTYLDRLAYDYCRHRNPFVAPPGLRAALLRNPLTSYLVQGEEVRLDSRYLRVRGETRPQIVQGGLIGLDGIHPTTTGYGVLADYFRQIMAKAGVEFLRPFDWDFVVNSDTLLTAPPVLLRQISALFDFLATPQLNALRSAIELIGRSGTAQENAS